MPDILQVLADPRRQQILQLIWSAERSAGDIASHVDVTFGAVSQHLTILRDAGAVTLRKAGRFHFYRANQPALGPLAEHLAATWRSRLTRLKTMAEAEERRNAARRRR